MPQQTGLVSECRSDVELFKMAMGDNSDEESIFDSDSDRGRDYTRGLAQRATEPDIKDRKSKGSFMVGVLRSRQASTIPY